MDAFDIDIEGWKTEIKRGLIEFCILALLWRGEMYGYEISKQLSSLTNGLLEVEEGTLYPLLRRLENKGYIKGAWRIRGGKARKYYSLQPRGIRALIAMKNFWLSLVDAVNKIVEGVER